MKIKQVDLLIVTFLTIISSVLIFNNLGSSTLWDWDEARNAENALEILKTNDWIVLKYGGNPDLWNTKPPLTQWLIAISFKVFGFTEFAVRFWSAVFGVATIVLVYLFGSAIKNKYLGFYSAIILLSTKGFMGYHSARTGDQDVMVAFFITLSLYLFYLCQKTENKIFLIWTAIAIAFGVLVKGIIGLFPVMIIGLYLLYFRCLKETLLTKETGYAIIYFFVVVAPCFILCYLRGKEFFVKMFEHDLLKRFSQPIEGHSGHILYYLFALKDGLGNLLSALSAIAFIYALCLMIKKNKEVSLLMIWIFSFLIIFTVASTKLFWYIIPAYPAISLLIAYTLNVLQQSTKIKKIFFILFFSLLMINPISSTIQSTQTININSEVQFIKDSNEKLKEINIIYIHSNENRQSIFFYLNSYAKENVYVYHELHDIDAKRGDGIITFNSDRIRMLTEKQDYKLIKRKGRAAIFIKN